MRRLPSAGPERGSQSWVPVDPRANYSGTERQGGSGTGFLRVLVRCYDVSDEPDDANDVKLSI